MGEPWKEDLLSKKAGFGLEEREVRVVAMDAIDDMGYED